MAKIELTNKQLRLIQDALELYSRVGILQIDHIFDHPSIDRILMKNNTKDKELKVGAQTMRGEIVEMGDGFIKTKGNWCNGEEIKTWTDVENIQLSPDWGEFHNKKDTAKALFSEVNRLITNDRNFSNGMSLGIHNEDVKECREAFDIIQVIRHEFWKENSKHSDMTVDSSISLTSGEPTVKVQLDTVKDIRKIKLNKIKNV
jgi:hypothetical protein